MGASKDATRATTYKACIDPLVLSELRRIAPFQSVVCVVLGWKSWAPKIYRLAGHLLLNTRTPESQTPNPEKALYTQDICSQQDSGKSSLLPGCCVELGSSQIGAGSSKKMLCVGPLTIRLKDDFERQVPPNFDENSSERRT